MSIKPAAGQTGAAFTAIYTAFGVITPGSVVPFDQCLTLNTTNPTSPWSPYRAKFKEHNLPWQVGLDWKPVDGVLVYGNVSKGYKAGGFPAVAGASSSDQLTPYVQESLLSYEAGTKARVGRALILQGAVFHYDYANKQIHSVIPDPLFGVLTRIRNVPKSKVTGAELQVNWQSSFGLSVDASGTYLDSKITRFDGFSRTGAPVNFAGSNLPYTSQWSGSLDISHQQNIANNKIGFVGARGSYRSSAFNAFGPEGPENDKISAYTLLDLRIGVKAADGGWQFSLWGKNVTNKFYITSEGPASDTTYARYVGMPATYGATLSFKLR